MRTPTQQQTGRPAALVRRGDLLPEQVRREHDRGDGDARRVSQPPGGVQEGPRVDQHRAPLRVGRSDPETEEAQSGDRQHDGAQVRARVDQAGPEGRRQQVVPDDPPPRRPEHPQRVDVRAGSCGAHPGARDPGVRRPTDRSQCPHDRRRSRPPDPDHGERDQQRRQGQHEVDEANHDRVDHAADEASDDAHQQADTDRDDQHGRGDEQRDPGRVDQAGKLVAAELIGAQPVLGRRRLQPRAEVVEVRIGGRQPGRQQTEDGEQHDRRRRDTDRQASGLLRTAAHAWLRSRGSIMVCAASARVLANRIASPK